MSSPLTLSEMKIIIYNKVNNKGISLNQAKQELKDELKIMNKLSQSKMKGGKNKMEDETNDNDYEDYDEAEGFIGKPFPW
jgi:hypothetical protein